MGSLAVELGEDQGDDGGGVIGDLLQAVRIHFGMDVAFVPEPAAGPPLRVQNGGGVPDPGLPPHPKVSRSWRAVLPRT